jgi:hypothetical protein
MFMWFFFCLESENKNDTGVFSTKGENAMNARFLWIALMLIDLEQ